MASQWNTARWKPFRSQRNMVPWSSCQPSSKPNTAKSCLRRRKRPKARLPQWKACEAAVTLLLTLSTPLLTGLARIALAGICIYAWNYNLRIWGVKSRKTESFQKMKSSKSDAISAKPWLSAIAKESSTAISNRITFFIVTTAITNLATSVFQKVWLIPFTAMRAPVLEHSLICQQSSWRVSTTGSWISTVLALCCMN